MKIEMLGVGEAFDPAERNSALIVEEGGFRLLIDCGHSIPPALWRIPDAAEIDAVYLTHHHPDHVFGLVPVLDAFKDEGRRKPLDLITTAWGIEHVKRLCEAGLLPLEKLTFALRFHDSAGLTGIGPWQAAFARTDHSAVNHAVKLAARGKRFAHSGDGRPTEASRALFADADLLFHECYVVEGTPPPGHADLATIRGISGPSRIGLYHLRKDQRAPAPSKLEGDSRCFLLQAGDTIDL